MEIIAYSVIAFIVGVLLCYLILNGKLQKLKIQNATKLSKEEVDLHFVNRKFHDSIAASLSSVQADLDKEKLSNGLHQSSILRLTRESEGKLTKTEVEKDYTARESFDLIHGKLTTADDEIAKKDQIILDLTRDLKEFQGKEKHLNEKLTTFKDELADLHTRSHNEFKNLANDVLEEKKKIFVDENKKELKNILDRFQSQAI
jgi:DNA recombination protein RmuC